MTEEKLLQYKMQLVTTATCASAVFAPVDIEENTRQAEVTHTSIRSRQSQMQQQHATTRTPTAKPDQDQYISTIGVHDAAINATCISSLLLRIFMQ